MIHRVMQMPTWAQDTIPGPAAVLRRNRFGKQCAEKRVSILAKQEIGICLEGSDPHCLETET